MNEQEKPLQAFTPLAQSSLPCHSESRARAVPDRQPVRSHSPCTSRVSGVGADVPWLTELPHAGKGHKWPPLVGTR
ncbi:hypothetical protein BaRGS_00034591 [Batillaria attramentaria]|uniref:Uncharacterized protein n=1 Tax=Batillaria attramentaria TaxID=370345 RepID=A0ABD0JHK5_9CAEN